MKTETFVRSAFYALALALIVLPTSACAWAQSFPYALPLSLPEIAIATAAGAFGGAVAVWANLTIRSDNPEEKVS